MTSYFNTSLQQDEWNPPLTLVEGVHLQPWPKGVFPGIFETFVSELARSTETPIELAAMITLSTVATVSQQKYQVQVKSDCIEPVNIWTLPVLPPASRKSRVYSEATARMAALIHVMRFAHSDPESQSISLEDMASAVKIGHLLIGHARAVFELIETDSVADIARSILTWVKVERRHQFKFRDCQRKFRRFKKAELTAGIDVLKEHEFLKEWTFKPGAGRPSDIFEVNPTLFEKEQTAEKGDDKER